MRSSLQFNPTRSHAEHPAYDLNAMRASVIAGQMKLRKILNTPFFGSKTYGRLDLPGITSSRIQTDPADSVTGMISRSRVKTTPESFRVGNNHEPGSIKRCDLKAVCPLPVP